MAERAMCRVGEDGFMESMPENPMHDLEVWVKCRVKVHSDWVGWPIYLVGAQDFAIYSLEDVEWQYVKPSEDDVGREE